MCGIARSLAEAGFTVVVGGGDVAPAAYMDLSEGEPAGSIKYIGLGEIPAADATLLGKSLRIFLAWGARTVAWLDSQAVKPSHVIVYGGGAPYMLRLLRWCKRNNVKLIADVVEWYDPRQLAGGKFGPFNLSAKFALKFLYPRCDGVIAISKLLEHHYAAKGCNVVRIPPTLDVLGSASEAELIARESDLLNLIYFGTPGQKDLLQNVIEGVAKVDPEGVRIRLQVLGPSRDEVARSVGNSNLPASISVPGRVSQAQVRRFVKDADFSVLLREPLRFANAGFPTKFVESFACGTPVISNITSDLWMYLRDGIEGVVCDGHSVDEFAHALDRALKLTPAQRAEMRCSARNQAEKAFDFRAYANDMALFMMRCDVTIGSRCNSPGEVGNE